MHRVFCVPLCNKYLQKKRVLFTPFISALVSVPFTLLFNASWHLMDYTFCPYFVRRALYTAHIIQQYFSSVVCFFLRFCILAGIKQVQKKKSAIIFHLLYVEIVAEIFGFSNALEIYKSSVSAQWLDFLKNVIFN